MPIEGVVKIEFHHARIMVCTSAADMKARTKFIGCFDGHQLGVSATADDFDQSAFIGTDARKSVV